MILQTKQTFDKYMLDRTDSSEFLKFVTQHAEQELVSKIIDELQDHKLYIVKLREPWTENENIYGTLAYRQELIYERIVQCRNCRMAYPWCQRFRDELDGDGFCPYGKEIEDDQIFLR